MAEEPTPLPDSVEPEAVKRCQCERCPNSEAIVDRLAVEERECKRRRILLQHTEHRFFREEILRLAVEERECKRLRILLQRTEHRFREYILFSGGDPGDFICSRDFVPDIIHVPVDHEAVTKAAPKATEAAPEAAKKAPKATPKASTERKSSEALPKSSEIKSTQDLLDEYRSIEIGNLVHVPTHLTRATFNCTARAMSRLEMDKIFAVMTELEDNPSDIIHVPVGHTHDVEDIDREERPL